MDEKEIIREFKILASKLKKDDTIVYLEQAQKMNDMDQELQDLIGKLKYLPNELSGLRL